MREWSDGDSAYFFLDAGVKLYELSRPDLAEGCLLYSYALAVKAKDRELQARLAQALGDSKDLQTTCEKLKDGAFRVADELRHTATNFGEGVEFVINRNNFLIICVKDTLDRHPLRNPFAIFLS